MLRSKVFEPLLTASIAALFLQSQRHQVLAAASFFSLGYNKMHTTFRDNSNGMITVSPKNEQAQSGLVVICHGLGDTAEGFVDVAEVCSDIFGSFSI
jgi:alpha-beta hydrolase superfamily lysophospholipase